MAWSRKKILAKLSQYFEGKQIPYEILEEEKQIKIDLFFKTYGFMLYPYITITDQICSIDINVSESSSKGFSFDKINTFNKQSKFFKAFLSDEGIVTLEYRFIQNEIHFEVLDTIFDSLYGAEPLIDAL